MKKIGICACYDTRNFGSMLQALATQIAVENLGYESEYIIYKKKKTPAYLIKQAPRLLNRNLMSDRVRVYKRKKTVKKYPDIYSGTLLREKNFRRFQKEHYRHFSKPYYGYDALKKGATNYSSVVVGSDQLWTPGGLATNFYNLMFVPDHVNKVSYATSFGVSQIPWYQRSRTRKYLKRIDSLSVREVRGREIIKEISGRDAKVVVDPTLLLTKEEWMETIPPKRIVEEPYIFCYFLGENPEHRKIAEELKEKTGLKIVCTPFLDSFVPCDKTFGDQQLFDIGPDDFVNLIRGAEFILTDSFHGSVFSIIHHKKFITLNRFAGGQQSRNSRIDSLCQILGLEDRRYRSNILEEMEAAIDYDAVEEKKEAMRIDSLIFLKESIGRTT